MIRSTISEAIKHYFKNTTLHGFKYLCSIHCSDRVGWLLCCCASACCAGVLCAVLWTRFLEVPALLALCDDVRKDIYMEYRVPAVAVCPSTESVAEIFLEKLSTNKSLTERIPITLARLLAGKTAAKDQLLLLDELLTSNNVTLPQVMMQYTPSCNEYAKKCRYQNILVPCGQLFEKELTSWGLCCVMRPNKLSNVSLGFIARSHITQMLDFVLQCSYGSKVYGCQFTTIYEGEEWVEPDALSPGFFYMAKLRFTAIPVNTNNEKLFENTCVHHKSYSKEVCTLKCAEKVCGCRDLLHFQYTDLKHGLPMCLAARLGCLRANEYKQFENMTCHCLPSCKKISTYLVLTPSPMMVKQAIDPFYFELNATSSIVVNLRVNLGHSRVFVLNPSETWLTLLSSLGGVFNMFLGVGLFSALELLYFLVVNLPIALQKSPEKDPITRYTTPATVAAAVR